MRRICKVFIAVILTIFLSADVFGQNPASRQNPTPNPPGRQSPLSRPSQGGFSPFGRNPLAKPSAQPQSGVPTPSALPSQRLASQAPKASKGANRQSCLLRSSRKSGSSDIVEISLEAAGEVKQSASEATGANGTTGGKMEVVAGFRYEERIDRYDLSQETASIRSIRQYDQAGMKRHYNGVITRPLLDRSRKNIICDYDGGKMTLYSPAGPFKNDQFLLIDELPANTALLDLLLPNREVRLGDEWTISDAALRALLGWDAVENNTVRLVLTAIIDDMAQVDLFLGDAGSDQDGNPLPSTLQGASLGASISADIQGKFQFDLKTNRMTWFGLMMTENRSESLVEPGLDWKATLRIRIAPLQNPENLTDDALDSLFKEPAPELLELLYNGQKGPWSFRHAREWRMIEDGEKSAALTFIANGEGIAQCNILSNDKIELDSLPTMDAYKAELKKGLGERFGRFVTESEYMSDFGDRVYAVMIDGQYEEIPFRWLYYLITDAAGHQVTVMFEIRADELDRFGDSGREIIDSFRLLFPDDAVSEPDVPESEKKPADFERVAPTEPEPSAEKPAEESTGEPEGETPPVPETP